MRHTYRLALIAAACLTGVATAQQDATPTFPLKDGDIWVMAGDSITAQHLHSNYFEAFCYARYPKLTFAFRNSGVGGHTIPSTLARFEYDVAAWKPTVISVELGMNDSGGTATDRFVANMETMVKRIRSVNARPVIFAASPVNDGTTTARLAGRNVRLDEYATALKVFCQKEKVPYADQFHALVDVWGKNKPRENLANTIASLRGLASDDSVSGVEHLRAFLVAQEKDPVKAVSMQGDPVHPGPPGQLMMATALLKQLGAESFVSSATIDTTAAKAEAKGCTVSNVKVTDGVLEFDRLDDCLPFPIPDDARAVLPLTPDVLALSAYTLKVTHLPAGDYQLKIDGVVCGRFSGKDLAAGVNLTSLSNNAKASNPIAEQGRAILAAVTAKESVVSKWRALSQKAHAKDADPMLKDDLTALTKTVAEADAKIREAAKPRTQHFVVEPVAAK